MLSEPPTKYIFDPSFQRKENKPFSQQKNEERKLSWQHCNNTDIDKKNSKGSFIFIGTSHAPQQPNRIERYFSVKSFKRSLHFQIQNASLLQFGSDTTKLKVRL